MGILNTVTYAVQTEDAMQFASFLETLRLEDVYQECTGLPDGSEVKMDRCFAYPYSFRPAIFRTFLSENWIRLNSDEAPLSK